MSKIIDLDKLVTNKEKGVKLGGKVHFMKALTVKDYVEQMKATAEIQKLVEGSEDILNAERAMELTINALDVLFPTIERAQFEGLTMDQLTAIRELAEDFSSEEAPAPETAPGE